MFFSLSSHFLLLPKNVFSHPPGAGITGILRPILEEKLKFYNAIDHMALYKYTYFYISNKVFRKGTLFIDYSCKSHPLEKTL